MNASKPLCKRLWQRIVQAKIRNQAALLADERTRNRLLELARAVRSDDAGNREAQAARIYWAKLFGGLPEGVIDTPFRRRREGAAPNPFLDYGYAVLRAAVARSLCAAGLNPSLGIHHHNRYDNFCLADDLIEPFRPWIDRCARTLLEAGTTEIDRDAKAELLGVLTADVTTNAGTGPLTVAVERTASSLAQCFLDAAEGGAAVDVARRILLPDMPSGETEDANWRVPRDVAPGDVRSAGQDAEAAQAGDWLPQESARGRLCHDAVLDLLAAVPER